jgi:hypothetical protein
MERLRSMVGAHRSEAVPALLQRLLRGLPDPEHHDDVCALAVRLAPAE